MARLSATRIGVLTMTGAFAALIFGSALRTPGVTLLDALFATIFMVGLPAGIGYTLRRIGPVLHWYTREDDHDAE
jgi:hypothetical protein